MNEVFNGHFKKGGKSLVTSKLIVMNLNLYITEVEDISRLVKRKIIVSEKLDPEISDTLTPKQKTCLEVFNGICVLLRRNIDYSLLLGILTNPSAVKSMEFKLPSDPEAFTKYAIIEPLLSLLNYDGYYPEAHTKSNKKVDYLIPSLSEKAILIEAKSIGSNLFNRTGAKAQAKKYINDWKTESFGIATDGLRWMLITKCPESTVSLNVEVVDLRPLFIDIIMIGIGKKDTIDDSSLIILDEFIKIFSKETIYKEESKLSNTKMEQKDVNKEHNKGKKKHYLSISVMELLLD